MDLFFSVCGALGISILLYGALYGVLLFCRTGSLRRPVRTQEAVLLVVAGSSAVQVFATQPVGVSLLVLGLLSALTYLGHWLNARFISPVVVAEAPPLLLLYRGCLLPEALADVAWSEAELRQRLQAQGVVALEHLHAVVLEANGRLGVIKPAAADPLYPFHPN